MTNSDHWGVGQYSQLNPGAYAALFVLWGTSA